MVIVIIKDATATCTEEEKKHWEWRSVKRFKVAGYRGSELVSDNIGC